jgi:oligopeptide/dipeptide ABC transporter ATP-binding protein
MKGGEGEPTDVLLEVKGLCTYFYTEEGEIRAVDGVDFQLKKGRTLAIVGESGCGKSVTAFSLLRLIQAPGKLVGGSILYRNLQGEERDVLKLKDGSDELFQLRGGAIGMIFQDALAALSPVHTIEDQLVETLRTHRPMEKRRASARALELLTEVGLTQPEMRLRQYPHELSGGMRQRVMIAMALITDPQILIADEPTTALDVTIQLQILSLIKNLQKDRESAVLLITHDLGVVAHSADEVVVMYLGKVVERGDVRTLLKKPRHPYTQGLLSSLPSGEKKLKRLPSIEGSVPALSQIPAGCTFHPRCPYHRPGLCDQGGSPPLTDLSGGHEAACLRLVELALEEAPR